MKVQEIYNLSSKNDFNLDWRNYWQILKRRKWFIIIPAILAGLAGFYIALSIVPIYESSSAILVSGGKLTTSSVRGVIPGVADLEDISAVVSFVLSDQCISELINTLGLKKDPGLHEQAVKLKAQLPDMSVEELENKLFIEQVRKYINVRTRGRDIVQISSTNPDPNTAYLIVKTMTQVFIDEVQKRQLSGIRGVREFSEEQLVIYEKKLRESEEKLERFKKGMLRAQVESDTTKSYETIRRLRSDVIALEVSIRDKEDRLGFLNSRIASKNLGRVKVDNQKISSLKQELFAKIDNLVKILTNYGWKDPQIIALNNEINQFRERIRKEIENFVNSNYMKYDNSSRVLMVESNITSLDLEIFHYEKNALSSLIDDIQKSLTRGPTYEIILQNLQREVEQNRNVYLRFLEQSRGTQIEEEIQRKDAEFKLQIVEMPTKPLYPKSSGQKKILALAGLLGLGLGVGIVYLLEYVDQSVKDVDVVEKKFNLPVWGVIPNLQELNVSIWKRDGWLVLLVMLGTVIAAALIYIIKKGAILQI